MLEAARNYIKSGYSVIPLKPRDKTPVILWKEFQERYATDDELVKWFKNTENNIAVITGEISKVSVLDIDSQDALKLAKSKGLPKTKLIKTGKPNGWHCYYQYEPGLRNWQARTDLPGIDIRSDGGYVVAPPSIHPNGRQYKCLKDIALGSIPSWVLLNNTINTIYNIGGSSQQSSLSSCVVNLFDLHRRDIDLFHVTNCLVKGRCEEAYIREVLKRLINSWGENDPKWIEDKIKSAFERVARKERNLAQDIKDFVLSSSGVFLSSEVGKCLQVSSRDDLKNLSKILSRLCEEGIIEKYGNKNGMFRLIEKEINEVNWIDIDINEIPVRYPFGIHQEFVTMPKNIIIISGTSNAGKSAFLLDFVNRNMEKFRGRIHYFSSEMGAMELKARILNFGYDLDFWKDKFKFYERAGNFSDIIKPDEINIIDYLDVTDEFWKVGTYIKDIFDKLDQGIALIALQKNPEKEYGRGGAMSIEKARLYITIDPGKLKLVKAKNWRTDVNPNGLFKTFKLIKGCNFKETCNGWQKDAKDYDNKHLIQTREPGEEG